MPLLAPVAAKLGIDLIWFGVLLCVNMQTSFMHPPFGFALFYLRGIAPQGGQDAPTSTGARSPGSVLQLILVAIVIFWPGLVHLHARQAESASTRARSRSRCRCRSTSRTQDQSEKAGEEQRRPTSARRRSNQDAAKKPRPRQGFVGRKALRRLLRRRLGASAGWPTLELNTKLSKVFSATRNQRNCSSRNFFQSVVDPS